MTRKQQDGSSRRLPASFVTGAIALAFLITGYQTALFVHRAAALKVIADITSPDTVYVSASDVEPGLPDGPGEQPSGGGRRSMKAHVVERRPGNRPAAAVEVVSTFSHRTCESFAFDPNTVSVADLCRLGFTVKQASSIDNYRKKGGRFRRKTDFAKSFVVADSVYRRLEPYIDIPLLDLNSADSASFDALPGIGGWFASRMVEYRERLGGYSFPEQLMDIYRFDGGKFAAISDLVGVVTEPRPFGLWSLPADSLRLHPYIGNWKTARAVVLYRENNPRTELTVAGLVRAGIIDASVGDKLSRCRISEP